MRLHRRNLLKLAAAAGLFSDVSTAATAAVGDAKARIRKAAGEQLRRNAARIDRTDFVSLVDFSAPSWRPRFHIVNMKTGDVASLLTAHGRGSDPQHSGWLKKFSNELGSNASSSGTYAIGRQYDGKYGRAIRLSGLDRDNDNAEARAIVIHKAWYVGDEMIRKYGKLGRSEGCFALSDEGLAAALAILSPGCLLYAGKFGEFAA